jgi:uncharacterized delta-60 repeat protein
MVSAAIGFALVLFLASSSFAAPGDRDPTFDDDGRAAVDFGTTYEGGEAVAVGADGSILIVGGIDQGGPLESLAMARLTSSGEPDLTFSDDGQQIVPSIGYGNGVALQEDGKIVVVAPGAVFASSFGWTVARFESDGTPDPTFGGGDGVAATDLDPDETDAPFDVVIQPDGKIVVVGFKGLSDGWRFAVVRYEADGDLDPEFANGGIRIARIGLASRATAVALQPNGKIVVVGHAQKGDEIHSGIARFLSSGSLDPAFSDDGKLITRFGVVDQASDVAIHPDGGIVIVGRAVTAGGNGFDFGVARYLPGGRPDPSFGGDGLVRTDFKGETDLARSVVIQANGKVIVGGYAYANSRSNFAIARYAASGKPNLPFGNQGRVRTNFGAGVDDYAHDIALDSFGLVAVGWGTPILGYDAAVARYLLS